MERSTGEEIAQRAQEFKIVYLAQQLSLTVLAHPDLPMLRHYQTLLESGPGEAIPVDLVDGPEHEKLQFSMREILANVSQLRGEIFQDLMSMSMFNAATRLGYMISTGGHECRDEPLLEFARHFRNACAHGDRWHFLGAEPRVPAICRELILTSSLHGKRATWTTVTPRLFILFLDDLSNYFAPGLARPSQVPVIPPS